jgi:tight adherence protein C
MRSYLPILIFLAVVAVLAGGGFMLWYQRSPRRAALATLRVATAPPRAVTPTRPGGAAAGQGQADLSSESTPPLKLVSDSAVTAVAGLARRLSPPAYAASVRRRLRLAGKDRQIDADRFLAIRVLSLALIVPIFLLISSSSFPGVYRLLAFFLFASLLGLGPEAALNRAMSERQEKIRRDLPILVELLMISVEAGLGFDQALARSVGSVPGPLGEEFSRFLGEVRMGSDHRAALEAIDYRTDVDELRSFLMALIQAETFGVPIGPILRSQANEVRIAQRQHVEEQAQKAPVKMLFPMVFCVLPALFVVIAGPAAIQIYDEFHKIQQPAAPTTTVHTTTTVPITTTVPTTATATTK